MSLVAKREEVTGVSMDFNLKKKIEANKTFLQQWQWTMCKCPERFMLTYNGNTKQDLENHSGH